MFGFRPGRRTADPLLVLRHMIDMNRAGVGTKFGVAFMDLSAAAAIICCILDSIDRDLLFSKLKHRGMSDHSINTLKHMNPNTTYIVKCDQGERKKERKKWRTSLSPKAMGPRAAAGGKCAV